MNRPRLSVAAALLAVAAFAGPAPADPPRASFECLPAETVLSVRLSSVNQTLEHLRAHTMLGRTLLAKQRWEKLDQLAKSQSNDDWAEFEQKLAEVGLEPEDLERLYDGELGYGLVLEPREQSTPMLIGIAWAEPGEEMAEKYLAALGRGVAMVNEEADEVRQTRRTDLEVAGHAVMHLAVPQVDVEYDWGADADDATEESIDGMALKAAAPRKVVTHNDQANFFATRIGGRLILLHTFPMNQAQFEAAGENPDFDEVSGVEQATRVLARFLEAHAGGAADDTFAARMLATPGLAEAMPQGRPVLELYADPKPVRALFDRPDAPNGEQVRRFAKQFGLDGLGPLAVRWSLKGQALQGGTFLSAPAPRRGLLSLLDQPKQKPGVPAWVPANAVDYSHVSFDLGAAWTLGKNLAIEMLGQRAAANIEQVEVQVQAFAQNDLASVLTGLGTRHTHVSFNPIGADGDEQVKPGNAFRGALVWQLQDEPTWTTIMTGLTPFTAMTNGAVTTANEQGFTGFRLTVPNAEMEVALMIGKGYLSLTYGNETTAPLLHTLRQPPTGQGALVNTEGYQRFGQMFEARPGLTYSYVDAGHVAGSLYDLIVKAIEDGAEYDETLDELSELLPTRDEVTSSFGVGGGHTVVNEHGLTGRSLLELPKTEE